ncbi:DUF2637 domain-containing protein [Streptomyces ipomoeae]|uniref:DUF2637 domain-containing protein n=1 Tax=Streptomyces ipomoeae TaxID=103232 RepID=UPI0029AAE4FE|nr:DUF2637 domain-containing protein [Streptomyces ipomoeae]MDX2697593.1 DUF2637 domain-containing protein [Streptomyces ipomoeae]MDX2838038.1 DUF2637 domain-containing protein [Streptomyces ipomoeae]
MKRPDALRALGAGAALVTIALTAAAFWLSYEHLHDVAHTNGLNDPARSWAWPATVDMFIVIGELLILRASLRGTVDKWAIGLAASGSLGSIALNVAGVGTDASAMEYVVAAVPPVAALLAFGALMRQVHEALERITASAPAATASPAPATKPSASGTAAVPPAPAEKPASTLPAAGASRAPAPASAPRQPVAKPAVPAAPPVPTPAAGQTATPASASDANTGRDLDEVAAAYRALRVSLGVRRPSSAKLGEALGVSRSRGQQLRDQLETHPDYRDEFAPALKSAG